MRGAARLAAGTLLCAPLAASGAEVALSFSEAPGGVGAGFRIERRESGSEHFAPIALPTCVALSSSASRGATHRWRSLPTATC